jgi:YidC/Oxa1 family membrane protein insertase
MFTTFIAQPIFNLLVAIYALLPGHNFGLAIIVFTIIIRLLLWPLVRKQLHQSKAMRAVAPELKRIKRETKGDRQKEARLTMELYKERGIKPLGSIGVMLLQLPVLLALYSGLNRVIKDPHQLVNFAYPFLQHFGWMQQLAHNIKLFDGTLFGVVDLTRSALGQHGVYWPAMIIVIASAVVQYFASKQLIPQDKDARSLRTLLKSAGSGNQADQSEINAAVGRSTLFILPVIIFLFTVNLASALSLYWLVGGLVAFTQQMIVLRGDETEMEQIADAPARKVADIPEAEIVQTPKRSASKAKPATTRSQRKKAAKKRRK